MKKRLLFCSLSIGLIFFFVDLSGVFAQETASDEFTLEEIVVTAAKRGEQNLQKVPLAMDVISNKDLAAEGKANVDDILSGLASVFINTNADGMRISIRGYTDTDPVYSGRKSSSPTVAMNVDGAYNSMNSSGQNLFDIERIEVLMGPQSTLYSANSPGGIVNIITTAPKTDQYSVNASAEYGSYKHSVLQAAFNAPLITDKLAIRLSTNRTRENSFLEPDELATKNDAARLKALWKATDDLEITLTGNYGKSGNRGEMGGQVVRFIKSSDDSWTASSSSGGGGENALDQITKGLNANIAWKSPVGSLTVVPSYSKSDASGNQSGTINTAPPGQPESLIDASWYSLRYTNQKGTEARLASSDDFTLFQYVVGVNYYKNEYGSKASYDSPNETRDNYTFNNAKQKAVYGNITYPFWFNQKFSGTLGYRKSWDYAHQITYDPGRPGTGIDETEMDVSNPDYKVGLQYDLSETVMFYGNYASSFRTDSMAMSNNNGVRPAEKLKAYTIGAKTRMLDNTIQLNTAAYYYDYRNKLAQEGRANTSLTQAELEELAFTEDTVTYDSTTKSFITIPAGTTYWSRVDQTRGSDRDGVMYYEISDGGFQNWGNARTIGLDASVSWVASAKDMVEVSASYLNNKWTNLRFNYLYEEIWADKNYDGSAGPNSPKFSATASYEHNFDIGGYGTLTPRVDMQFKSKFGLIFDQSDDAGTGADPGYATQEAYTVWNASLAFNHANGKWSINAIVKNATNYAVKRSYDKEQKTMMIGDPRTYSATLSVKF